MKVRTNVQSGLTASDLWQNVGTIAQSLGTAALGLAKQVGGLAASATDATLKVASKPSFWLWPFG